MYVATVPNCKSPPAILLRESYRLNGKVKSRTIANISHLPRTVAAQNAGGKDATPLTVATRGIRPESTVCPVRETV
jgi:hypothetical protein